eukprot:scaffold188192_cov18-Tisochrysis_lutea.AAC.1
MAPHVAYSVCVAAAECSIPQIPGSHVLQSTRAWSPDKDGQMQLRPYVCSSLQLPSDVGCVLVAS